MNELWKNSVWQQLGAAIDMLDNTLVDCPTELWQAAVWPNDAGFSDFWYVSYHTLFFLDLYLSGAVAGFLPPDPFTLDELDPAGVLPPRVYTKEELRTYLAHCRHKCQSVTETLTPERAAERCRFPWGEVSFAGLLLDNMRHVQEHGAQLRLFLGQQQGTAAKWVAQVKS
ncbi:MAG: DinB family protein [Caldilineaceae bacterium]